MDIYYFRHIGHFLVSPINQSLLLLAVAWGVSLVSKQRLKPIKPTLMVILLWLGLCSQPYFSHSLVLPFEEFAPVVKKDDPRVSNSNSIFVLACFMEKQRPLPEVSGWNECSLQRLVQAAILYQTKPTTVYVSGGDFLGETEETYTDAAESLLLSLGVDGNDIVKIAKGTNTLEEMQAVYALLPAGQVSIVSSATHMTRISLLHEQLQHQYQDKVIRPLLFPVDHIVTRELKPTIHMPGYYSIEVTERAFYEHLAIAALKLK